MSKKIKIRKPLNGMEEEVYGNKKN